MVESIVPAANLMGGSANWGTSGELRERDENRLRWRRRNDAANSSKSTVDRAAPMTNHAETLALARLLRQKVRVGLLTPRLGQRAFSSSRNRSNNGSMRLFASRAACQHRVTAAGPYRSCTGFPQSSLRSGWPTRKKDHLVPLWTIPILIGPGSSVKPASKSGAHPVNEPAAFFSVKKNTQPLDASMLSSDFPAVRREQWHGTQSLIATKGYLRQTGIPTTISRDPAKLTNRPAAATALLSHMASAEPVHLQVALAAGEISGDSKRRAR